MHRLIIDKIRRIVFSYDSNCQYSINFEKRLFGTDPALFSLEDFRKTVVQFLIPKFHLGGHKAECSDRFSFNYTANVGRMSGELVETPWAALNWLQYASREMGWGNRRDLLNDHFNWWNWMKIVRMGEFARRTVRTHSIRRAMPARNHTT